jgi:hypothetical protein
MTQNLTGEIAIVTEPGRVIGAATEGARVVSIYPPPQVTALPAKRSTFEQQHSGRRSGCQPDGSIRRLPSSYRVDRILV